MDDILHNIIEMDKQAQRKVEELEQYCLDAISSLNEKKNTIISEEKEKALSSAQSKSQKNKVLNEKYLKQMQQRNVTIMKNMDDLFEKNKDSWAERIFSETVGE